MNLVKLVAPDFFIGKMLGAGKALLDSLMLCVRSPTPESLQFVKLVLQVKPQFTMVKTQNLRQLYRLVQDLNHRNLGGDVVECGVWNGGSAALMGAACVNGKDARSLWLFDSFGGLPPPSERDGETERASYFEGWNKGEVKNVHKAFQRLGVPLQAAHIIPGLFEETLQTARVEQIERIALLHIDADWYDSVRCVLNQLYDKVVPGGFVVLDDYGYWQGCNRALEDYMAEHQLTHIHVKHIGRTGAYFQKPM